MEHTCGHMWVCGLIWYVVASLLLFVTWNKVMTVVAKAKAVKWWHAFLFLGTVIVLCTPCIKSRMHCGHCAVDGGKHCPYDGAAKQ